MTNAWSLDQELAELQNAWGVPFYAQKDGNSLFRVYTSNLWFYASSREFYDPRDAITEMWVIMRKWRF